MITEEQKQKAKKFGQDLLDRLTPGAVLKFADEVPTLPRFADEGEIEMHVFNVPEGRGYECMCEMLELLHGSIFSDDDIILIYPHSVKATQEHYSHIELN